MTERNFRVPSINQQMANLEPSKELMDYYQSKLFRYEEENDRLKLKLEEYLKISDQRHKLEEQLIRKGDKVRALQKGLNDMQQCLFHEREHVLKLYVEIDQHKLLRMENHEKILELLSMTGNTDLQDKVIYIFNEPPLSINICERRVGNDNDEAQTKVKLPQTRSKTSLFPMKRTKSNDILKTQVETLEVQLEEHKKLAKEQLDSMAESYKISTQEADARMMMDRDKIVSLSDRLKKTEELLRLSTFDFIELNKTVRRKEMRWAIEKDTLIQNLNGAVKNVVDSAEMKTLVREVSDAIKAADEFMKSGSNIDVHEYDVAKENKKDSLIDKYMQRPEKTLSTEPIRRSESILKPVNVQRSGNALRPVNVQSLQKVHKPDKTEKSQQSDGEVKEVAPRTRSSKASYYEDVKLLQQELDSIRNLNKAYRNQCSKLEDALNQLKEDQKSSQDQNKKKSDVLQERLQASSTQLKRLETYRKAELEGYKTDVKNLKQQVSVLEKQLMKAVILFEQGNKDMELLRTVHRTTVRSKQVVGELKLLKAKLYELEGELRNL